MGALHATSEHHKSLIRYNVKVWHVIVLYFFEKYHLSNKDSMIQFGYK